MIKKILKKYLPQGPFFNRFYLALYHFALWGMNFNRFENLTLSGERWALKFVKQQLSSEEQLILFDVGANQGEYTKIMAHFFSEKGKIHSFEPIKDVFNKLRRNTENDRNVSSFNIGLSSVNEEREIYYRNEYLSQASFVKANLEEGLSEIIKLRTLDSFCAEHHIDKIDFLKIDVEGLEMKVLEGANDLIDNGKIKFIQFEFGGTQIHARVFFKDFWDKLNYRYKLYRILKNGLLPINSYHEGLEIFHFSNYLAIRK